ncbi:MAG TPA: HlyD family type I secretion periplasmic adaptor subunit [Vineibacter sp.]|nr:HlyD family type I secretion periplasmic adaptor subunit [Vineibacter sp.]
MAAGTLLFTALFWIWGAVAPLASAAIAPGAIKSEGSRRTVQHLEDGIVRELLARDGDKVVAGQVVARLDDVASLAQHAALKSQRITLLTQQARLVAERAGQRDVVWPPDILSERLDPRVADAIAAQTALFISRRTSIDSQLKVLSERIGQLNAIIASVRSQIKSHDEQLELLRSEITIVAEVVRLGLEKKARLLSLLRQEAALLGNHSDLESQITRGTASIAETHAQMETLRARQANEIAGELADVRQKLVEVEEKEKQAADIAGRREIVAPVGGTVLNSCFFTVGGVVKPGDPLMDIVPLEDRLVAEVQVAPGDIDVVHTSLVAQVRLPAFKQRLVPFLTGKVTFVSADAVVDEKAQRSFYRAHVVIDAAELARLDNVHLTPGMPVEALILTGDRTFAEYIIQPLRDSFARAFREQ